MSTEENHAESPRIRRNLAIWSTRLLIFVVSIAAIAGLNIVLFESTEKYLAHEVAGIMALIFGAMFVGLAATIVEATAVENETNELESHRNQRISNSFVVGTLGLAIGLFVIAVFMITNTIPKAADLWAIAFGVGSGLIILRSNRQNLQLSEGKWRDVIHVVGFALNSLQARAALVIVAAIFVIPKIGEITVVGYASYFLTIALIFAYDRLSEPDNRD